MARASGESQRRCSIYVTPEVWQCSRSRRRRKKKKKAKKEKERNEREKWKRGGTVRVALLDFASNESSENGPCPSGS